METEKIVIELDHRGVLGVDADLKDTAFVYLIAPAISRLHKTIQALQESAKAQSTPQTVA